MFLVLLTVKIFIKFLLIYLKYFQLIVQISEGFYDSFFQYQQ